MKAIKYLFTAALLAGFSTAALAQDGSKADVDAVKKIISSKPADLDKQMKPFYKANKKNADNLVAFGREFLNVKDTANAKVYAEYALQASKNKCAPAFILLGDIEAISDNGGGAASFYDQAIYADPKNPDAYYKYALVYRKIDPKGSAQKLDELKQNCPDANVDVIKAHIFMLAKDEKAAYEIYKNVDINKMDKGNLNEFARASYFTGHFEDALKACEAGLKQVPRNPTFTRLAMFSNFELKNYEAAKAYIYKYFNETDSANFSEYDHYYAANIYQAIEDNANAHQEFNKALELVSDSSMIKKWAIYQGLSNLCLKENNFEEAAAYYKQFLGNKPDVSFDDYEGHANLHSKHADALTDNAAKEAALKKADAVYEEMQKKYENNYEYILYKRANIANKLDSDQSKGLAKPYYQALIERIAPKAEKSNSDKQIIVIAYHYMMAYSLFTEKDTAKAKEYAAKILEINPDYKAALDVSNLK